MLKVMLIDDEIMVLKHMENIVDWEVNGFQIIVAETRAMQGLKKLQNASVDVIFVDIRMPGMDGFEFSKQALLINPNVEIIILTSYGDFEYAKEALKIGVSNYLLKHEMNQHNFENELVQIRADILRKKRNNKVLLSQLLLEYLSFPQNIKSEELEYIRKSLSTTNKNIITFLVVRDRNVLPIEKNQNMNLFEEHLINYIELNYKGMIPVIINNDECLLIKPFSPMISQRQVLEIIHSNAYELQRHIKKQFLTSVSVIPSSALLDIEMLPSVYNKLKALSKYLIFFEKNKILYGREINPKYQMDEDKINERIYEIEKGLKRLDKNTIFKELNLFFAACEKNVDASAFYHFMSQFKNVLVLFLHEHRLNDHTNQHLQFLDGAYSVIQVHENLEKYIEELIAAIEREKLNQFSPKIQHTIIYLRENYMRDIKIDDVAEQANISGEYLRHIFKDEVGKGFSEYLTELRIEKAKSLLLEEKYKLYEIAEMVGYSSGSYFATVFKKNTGVKPQKYVEEYNV